MSDEALDTFTNTSVVLGLGDAVGSTRSSLAGVRALVGGQLAELAAGTVVVLDALLAVTRRTARDGGRNDYFLVCQSRLYKESNIAVVVGSLFRIAGPGDRVIQMSKCADDKRS